MDPATLEKKLAVFFLKKIFKNISEQLFWGMPWTRVTLYFFELAIDQWGINFVSQLSFPYSNSTIESPDQCEKSDKS